MDDSSVQIVIATVGVGGTLAGTLLGQALANRADRARRRDEDQSRWLSDRARVNTRFLAACLRLEREFWSKISFLDRDGRSERLPGYTSIFSVPESGLDGVLDALDREIIVEALREAERTLDEIEELTAEIVLVGTPDEFAASRQLVDALWDVFGAIESFQTFDAAADAVEHVRHVRDTFAARARAGIRNRGTIGPMDQAPRRDDS